MIQNCLPNTYWMIKETSRRYYHLAQEFNYGISLKTQFLQKLNGIITTMVIILRTFLQLD